MSRILVAEDEDAIRAFVQRALAQKGHTVDAVADGIEALQALSAGEYALLLTDIVMPGLDGIELALKASSERPEMGVILMTGFAAERQRAHNLEVLIHRVVTKPFTLRQICDVVDEALAARAA
jgi:CheY-like chemotaxis protein